MLDQRIGRFVLGLCMRCQTQAGDEGKTKNQFAKKVSFHSHFGVLNMLGIMYCGPITHSTTQVARR
jgi:hypothetical protein